MAEFEVGGKPFTIRGRPALTTGGEGRTHLSLLAKDIALVKESAEAWGGSLAEGPEDRETSEGRFYWATLTDPEGNTLEIVQRA